MDYDKAVTKIRWADYFFVMLAKRMPFYSWELRKRHNFGELDKQISDPSYFVRALVKIVYSTTAFIVQTFDIRQSKYDIFSRGLLNHINLISFVIAMKYGLFYSFLN